MNKIIKIIFQSLGVIMVLTWLGSCSIGIYTEHKGAIGMGAFAFCAVIVLFSIFKLEDE